MYLYQFFVIISFLFFLMYFLRVVIFLLDKLIFGFSIIIMLQFFSLLYVIGLWFILMFQLNFFVILLISLFIFILLLQYWLWERFISMEMFFGIIIMFWLFLVVVRVFESILFQQVSLFIKFLYRIKVCFEILNVVIILSFFWLEIILVIFGSWVKFLWYFCILLFILFMGMFFRLIFLVFSLLVRFWNWVQVFLSFLLWFLRQQVQNSVILQKIFDVRVFVIVLEFLKMMVMLVGFFLRIIMIVFEVMQQYLSLLVVLFFFRVMFWLFLVMIIFLMVLFIQGIRRMVMEGFFIVR